jgi:hypothetical protein
MKTRYDSKVKALQLEPDDLVFYYCPRRKIGKYQKWRRFCTLGMVMKRFNDVLYSVKLSPRSSPVIVHVDRLRHFEGETPEQWKSAMSAAQANKSAEAVALKEPSAVRPSVTQPAVFIRAEEPSVSTPSVLRPSASQSAVSIPEDEPSESTPSAVLPSESTRSVLRPSASQPSVSMCAGESSVSTPSVVQPSASIHGDEPSVGDNGQSASIANVVKTNRRTVQKLLRFRSVKIMEPAKECHQVKRVRMPRTEEAKQRRREMNRGPFPCPYCDRPPFPHRSGFRRHVIIVHHMNCSWNGIVRPFESEEHKVRVLAAVPRTGRHPSNRSNGTTIQQVGNAVSGHATAIACTPLSAVDLVFVDDA